MHGIVCEQPERGDFRRAGRLVGEVADEIDEVFRGDEGTEGGGGGRGK